MFALNYLYNKINGNPNAEKVIALRILKFGDIFWEYRFIRSLCYLTYAIYVILRVIIAPYVIYLSTFSTDDTLIFFLFSVLYSLIAMTKYITKAHIAFLNIIDKEFLYIDMFDDKDKQILNKAAICFVITLIATIIIMYEFTNLPDFIQVAYKNYQNTSIYPIINYLYYIEGNLHLFFGISSSALFIYFVLRQVIQIKILSERIKCIDKEFVFIKEQYRYESQLFQKVINERVCDCIRHHAIILLFHQKLVAYYSVVLSMKFHVMLLIFIVVFFVFVFVEFNSITNIIILHSIATVVVSLCYIYMGKLIINEYCNLSIILSDAELYNWNPRNKKIYLIFSIQTIKPLFLTVKFVQEINLSFVIAVLRGIYNVIDAMFTLNIF